MTFDEFRSRLESHIPISISIQGSQKSISDLQIHFNTLHCILSESVASIPPIHYRRILDALDKKPQGNSQVFFVDRVTGTIYNNLNIEIN